MPAPVARELPTLYTSEEMAAVLGVNEATVWRYCRQGAVAHVKVGRYYRFTREHYDALVASNTHEKVDDLKPSGRRRPRR